MSIRPNRIGFDVSAEHKARIEQQALQRGFSGYKDYILSLIDKDRDTLAKVVKHEKRAAN
jgi:hypothetical protein